MFGKKKSKLELEMEFLKAARRSAGVPGAINREKAQKAFENLPADSKLRKMKFEGTRKSWR